MEKDTICIVKNRSSYNVGYSIEELGIKRRFLPGETKEISYEELVKLSYTPGGRNIMDRYLFIQKKEVTDSLGLSRELEYDWDEARVIQLLTQDSLDQFLDCLDYAPEGVKTLVKKLAVELPLGDPMKKKALREKLGTDVDAIYRNTVIGEEDELETTKKERRVKPETAAPARRYNVVG